MLRPPIGPSSFFITLVLSFLQFFRFRIQTKFTSKFLDFPKECLLLMKLSTSSSFQKLFSPKSKIVTAKSIRLKSQWYQIEFHVPQTINQAKRGGLDELWQGTNGFGRASWKCLSTSGYFKYSHENINQPTFWFGR